MASSHWIAVLRRSGRGTWAYERFGVRLEVEIQGCRAPQQAPSSPPPLDRRGQRAARLWPSLNGGEAGQVGLSYPPGWAADSSLPQSRPLSIFCPHLAHAAAIYQKLGLSSSSAVPYSAFPSERAARLALLAHRPRGFSPPSLSLFYSCRPLPSAPALLNQPSTTIALSTTINTQPQPHLQQLPSLPLASSPPTTHCPMVLA